MVTKKKSYLLFSGEQLNDLSGHQWMKFAVQGQFQIQSFEQYDANEFITHRIRQILVRFMVGQNWSPFWSTLEEITEVAELYSE